jgi:cytochrome P450
MESTIVPDDLLAADVIADPHPTFRALREEDPVHWSERHRAWLVTRFDDCCWVLSATAQASSDRVRPLLEVMSEERRAAAGPVYDMITGWMVVTDPPEHRRLRRAAAAAFNPRRVAAREERIKQLVDAFVEDFVASGEQDLISGFTYPLPATVIGEVIGAPEEDTDRFREWSNALAHVAFGAGGEVREDRHAVALEGLEQMLAYFGELIELRTAEPSEDMISDLLAGDGSGERLTDEEIKGMCALMLFAGHETTTSTIASAVLMLLSNPDQKELLLSDPDEHSGGVAEEVLRYDGAIKVLHRWVTEDFELRGKKIEKGQRVFVLPAAANRDPERFEDPDRVDITRTPNPHIGFGRGIHACIGAQLARLEMRIAIAALFRRMPEMRLAVDPAELRWLPSLASRGLEALPIEHDAGD